MRFRLGCWALEVKRPNGRERTMHTCSLKAVFWCIRALVSFMMKREASEWTGWRGWLLDEARTLRLRQGCDPQNRKRTSKPYPPNVP